MEKYSVLMSLYEKEHPKYLRLALDSMLGQTIRPDEIVLVEDGPLTAELHAVVAEYEETYPETMHVLRNERNLGLGLSLNIGLRACRNELVARMDTDDVSKPDRCEKQLKRLEEKPELAIVGCHAEEFVGDVENVTSTRRVPLTSPEIYEYGKRRSPFNHPSVIYKKSVVLEQGGYGDMRRNQDVDLFGRMLYAGCQGENLDEALLWFRNGTELAKRRKSWENTWSYVATIRKFWKMGYSSFRDYLMIAIAQTGMFLMPIKMQEWIYRKYLRKT